MLSKIKLNWILFIFISAVILLLCLFFRFYNLNWDQGLTFHPDERNIDNAVTKIHFFKDMNPEFFAYGGFPIYLYRAGGDLLNHITKQNIWTSDWGHINEIGRFFSALFSVLTIFPLYFLTKRLSNKTAAITAAALYAFCVTSIQTAHYGVTESLITLVCITVSYLALKILKEPKIKLTILLAIISGIGIASKASAVSFLIIPLLSYIFLLKSDTKKYKFVLFNFLVFSVFCFITFLIFSPYTFLDFNKFLESMKYESSVATGSLPVVYTLQFNGSLPYIFWLKNLFWQIGLSNVFCLIGMFFGFLQMVKNKRIDLLIFLSFPILYFTYIGIWHTKFIRYIVPIVPFLIISASIFLSFVYSKNKILGVALITSAVLANILWSLAFFSIYAKPQTRVAASEWIYNNMSKGSKILNEQWDDGLPVAIKDNNSSMYSITSLDMYSSDDQQKINYLSENLSSSDYIIFNSRRLYGTLIRLNNKYPITSEYYKLLFSGQLGYEKIKEFTSYPSLFGININDDSSEETFQVYDHPKVIIFRNDKYLTKEQISNILSNEKI